MFKLYIDLNILLCIFFRCLVLVSTSKWNTKGSVYHYITNSRGGVFAIMNNYWFFNMLTITIYVSILMLFIQFFFLSGAERTLQ